MARRPNIQPWWLVSLAVLVCGKTENATQTDNLLWGAYRPNLYFGLRPQIPQSLLTGLIWFGTQDYTSVSRARHACDQGDGLDKYSWTEYDAQLGGSQRIVDGQNNFELITEYAKFPGGSHGGSWGARVRGVPINPALPSRISLVFYVGLEGLGGFDMETDDNENGLDGDVIFTGSSPELNDFTLKFVDAPDNTILHEGKHQAAFTKRIGKTHIAGFRVPSGEVWKAKDVVMQNIITHAREAIAPYQDPATGPPDPSFTLQLNDEVLSGSNLYAVQKIFSGAFSFDVLFESVSAGQPLDGKALDAALQKLKVTYDQKFDSTYPVPTELKAGTDASSLKQFSKEITANLLGGVGYFYGTSIVDKGFAHEWDEEDLNTPSESTDKSDVKSSGGKLTEPRALLTATPSRSFFPRGFYWIPPASYWGMG